MNSRIYTGELMHARLAPKRHVFRYPVYFYAFDLAELDELDRRLPLFGYNRLRPIALHERDYLEEGPGAIREKLLKQLPLESAARVERIVLITSARFFNYAFNPASFYYCLDAAGDPVCFVVEVSNTFGERHVYVSEKFSRNHRGRWAARCQKEFHVSPFNDRQGEYEFEFSRLGQNIDLRINLWRNGQPILRTRLSGTARPLTNGSLMGVLLRYPLTAALTMPRILAQAAKLYFQKKLDVYKKPPPSSPNTIRHAKPTWKQRFAMRRILNHLSRIEIGALDLELPDGSLRRLGNPRAPHPVSLRVRHFDFFWRALKGGDLGFAEAYIDRDWECDELTDVFNLFIDNHDLVNGKDVPFSRLGRWINRLRHTAHRHTRRGSRRNIAAHYDLSNDFFETFLDKSMTYSSALYRHPDETLEEAQQNKLHAIIEKARIAPEHHVLEIGSGWGSFAIEAVRETGCRITTLTLSREQQQLARERIRQAGLEHRIDVKLLDYRDAEGQFDRIVSVEMIEAVGHENYPTWFAALERLLKPDGLVVVQAITIPDQRYERYRRSVDFISKHIFPGGHLPSLATLSEKMTKHSQFNIEHLENYNQHYARTLLEWRERFNQQRAQVSELGFDKPFQRKWEYYLAYCEAGFSKRMINVLQLVLTRQCNHTLPGLEKWNDDRHNNKHQSTLIGSGLL